MSCIKSRKSKPILKITLSGLLVAAISSATNAAPQELEEIIVTATKTRESLQDVSLAVTAIADERLIDGTISDVGALQGVIPNFSVGSDFGQAKIFIRGIGLNSSFAGVDPSVALHLDGAVISQSYAQLGAFFDLDRVEVLRGPQGTLYGRNATGGSVNLISKKPTEEFESYANVTMGNFDKLDLEGAVSGPLTDRIQGRLSYKSNSHAGYGINEVSGADIDNESRQSYRAQLNFRLSEDVNFLLSSDYATEDDNSGQLHYIDTYRGFELRQLGIANENNLPAGVSITGNEVTLADGRVVGVNRPAPGLGGYANRDRRNTASEIEPNNKKRSISFTGTLDWDINESWALRSISNYRDLDVLYQQDIDSSRVVNDDIQKNSVFSKQLSQELQLVYSGGRLNGLVGLYFFDENLVNDGNDIAFAFDDPATARNERDFVYLFGDIDIEAFGVFANFTYDLTDTLALKLGVRYSDETRSGDNFFRVNGNKFSCLPGTNEPAPTATADGNCVTKKSFTDTSPTIGLDWQFNDSTLLYASYTEGFKSGAVSGGQRTPITRPELIESVEIGVKSTFLDNRMRVNLAAFSYEIKDLQQSRSAPSSTGAFVNIFENAAAADGSGLELEFDWLITDRFMLNGFVSTLDAEFTDFVTDNPLFAGSLAENLSGNRQKQSPELSWNLHGEYTYPLSNGGTLSFALEAAFKDEQYFTEFNDEVERENDYTLVNAYVKYLSPDEKFFVNVWGKNITDEFVYTGKFVIGSVVTINGSLSPPATYGATFGYNF